MYVFLDLTLYSTWRKKYLRCYSLNQFRCISLNWRAPAFYNQLKNNSEYILNKKYVLRLDKDVFVMTRQRKQFGGPMRIQIWDLWIPCLNPLPLSHRYSSVSWAPTGFISLCDTRPTYCQDKLCQKRDISVRNKRDIFQLGHKKEKDALCILACLECWHSFVRRNEDDYVPWVWQCVCVCFKINSVSLPWMYLRCCTLQSNFNFVYFCFKKVESNIPLIPRRDKHLVCPHNITPESNNKITKKVSYSAPLEMNRKQPKEYAYWFSGLKVFKETCPKIVNEKSLDVTRPHDIILFTIPLI